MIKRKNILPVHTKKNPVIQNTAMLMLQSRMPEIRLAGINQEDMPEVIMTAVQVVIYALRFYVLTAVAI